MKELLNLLQELADRIKERIISDMSSDIGINKKVNKNTLINSDLMKSVSVEAIDENTIIFSIADYYEKVVQGRKEGIKLSSNEIESLKLWIRKKQIRFEGCDENTTLWLVIRSIYNYGIAPRPFIRSGEKNGEDPSKILRYLDDYFNTWSDDVFNLIITKLNKLFK